MVDAISYPTGLHYQESLYNTALAFQDPALRGGKPVLDPLGMPKAISGNFASVFTVNGTDGRRWAVKCFTRHVPDQALRYEQISKTLATVRSPWKVEFQYLPDGLLCRGHRYPVLKMEWIEATGLLPYIERHLTDRRRLADLARAFGDLVQDLSAHGIAHGDLQHGNILVLPSGQLKLVDYDGMFVPDLQSVGASEMGHRNYQSPLRNPTTWGPEIDRFSSWVIYASLTALALDPVLWQVLHADGDEALLFHQRDFTDRAGSRARYALAHSSLALLRDVARDIDFLWGTDLAAIPPLAMFAGTAGQLAALQPAGPGTASGIDWLRQRQRQTAAIASAGPASAPGTTGPAGSPGAATWLTTHLPVAQHLEFSAPRRSVRVGTALLLCAAVALGAATSAAIYLDPALAAVAWTLTFVSYRLSAESQEKTRGRGLLRERRSAAATASRHESDVAEAVYKRLRDLRGERSAAEARAEKARASEEREIDIVTAKLDRALERYGAQLSHSDRTAQGALRAQAAVEIAGLRRRWSIARDDAAQEIEIVDAWLATLSTQLEAQLAGARKRSETADWQRDYARLEFARYRRIRYSAYLWRLVVG